MTRRSKYIFGGIGVILMLAIIVVLKLFINPIPQEHRKLIESHGWSIEGIKENRVSVHLPIPSEVEASYRNLGINLEVAKNGTEIFRSRYKLREACSKEKIDAVVYFNDVKILGSYFLLTERDPGYARMENIDDFRRNHGCQ
ncbi:hypothetical protein ACFQ3W_01725 [Paenibacillus puldeungensis]|uniref:DUF4830 domain-containing protein n=1 Tax=Paenibacillus puldeungensis TaxID=696536 RepID=A0ABW3RRV7_9BACL